MTLLLALPLRLQAGDLLLQLGDLALDLVEARLARRVVLLASERLLLDLELRHAALQLVDLLRHDVDLHA